jgi:DNA primase
MHDDTFKPSGKELQQVFYYYGVEADDKIVCPFHNDHRPSCHVDYNFGTFHCFACGAGGDAFKFVKLANPKLNDLDCLILYYAILNSKKVKGLKITKMRKVNAVKQAKNKEDLLEIAHDYYYGLKSINWFKVKSEYKDYMLKRGYTSQMLNRCKVKLTITNNSYPIIIPIFDNGVFRGYQCRTTNKVIEKRRKYLYNEGFSRIDTLGGNYINKTVVIVEGYLDMLKLKQFGLKYVTCLFGWKMTSKQLDKLRAAGVKNVISALDTDRAGRDGTDYLKNFFDVIEFQYPKGVKDAGELTKQQFDAAYNKTKSLFRRRRNS